MKLLLIILAIIFCALPYDAQIGVIAFVQWIIATQPKALLIVAALGWPALWYARGWDALARRQWREERDRADATYQHRKSVK